ncbi:hypothetical protein AU252_01775 [Pseudarthrobacter sulfonivorans]|uniref:Uncharacterized protein n=2 Tax=Pseudarthrobacter sulfonivorans TaxID=121292 RepID=A0A0U3P3Y1_9MICC|nr:hypothetical protein AU252_01775 [Pseudarthrobacter sulfonivorans]
MLCLAFSTLAIPASPTLPNLWPILALSVLFAVAVGTIWFYRLQRANKWTARAVEQWRRLEATRLQVGTTTEVTILAIETVEPTGTWVTLRWNQFDHVQRAWMEALPDEIWEGTVLLISPDPSQIKLGNPWPTFYHLAAQKYLGFAPAAGRKDFEKLSERSPR